MFSSEIDTIVKSSSSLPQINIDNFNVETMTEILTHWGTFEINGPTIDNFRKIAEQALATTKEIFELPKEVREEVKQSKPTDFHGYQNVRAETREKLASEGKGVIRNQKAFHFKPYKQKEDPRFPKGIDSKAYKDYYDQGMKILHKLYEKIVTAYKIDPKKISNLSNDEQSVLTVRKYKKYKKTKEGETGIPPHSDYGLITLVVSDTSGLQVYKDQNWISAPIDSKLRFYINVGDWLLFQLNNKSFKVGIHRVPAVDGIRHSMALFLNPKFSEELETPKGLVATYAEYLRSNKAAFFTNAQMPTVEPKPLETNVTIDDKTEKSGMTNH